MTVDEIRRHARERGLRTSRGSKTVLVRSIQRQEGNFECFATAYERTCDQTACLWRNDCFALAARAA